MKAWAAREHEKRSLPCEYCLGVGYYEKIVTTVHQECESTLRKRVKEMKSENKRSVIDRVRPKVMFRMNERKEEKCLECRGTGRIEKVIRCCSKGCSSCNL